MSLSSKENKQVLISDEIYLNNLPLSRLVSASIPIAIALLAIVVTGLIACIPAGQQFKLVVFNNEIHNFNSAEMERKCQKMHNKY